MSAFNKLIGMVVLGMVVPHAHPGCHTTPHRMAEPKAGTTIACQRCYDEMIRVYKGPSGKYAMGGSSGWSKRHMCEGCNSEMTVYSDNGVIKMKCPKCVPEGVNCDKCLPPEKGKK